MSRDASDARRLIAARIAGRDLVAALADAQRLAATGDRDAATLAGPLARLLAMTERAREELATGPRTVPFDGLGLVSLHLRMGTLEEGERALLKHLAAGPPAADDQRALEDLRLVRAVLAGEAPPASPQRDDAEAPATERPPTWLDKRGARPASSTWSSSAGAQGDAARAVGAGAPDVAPGGAGFEEASETAVMQAARAADLLARSGHPERALERYRALAADDPTNAEYAARIAALERQLMRGGARLPEEPTVRRDLTAYRRQAVPTLPPEGAIPNAREGASKDGTSDAAPARAPEDSPAVVAVRPLVRVE